MASYPGAIVNFSTKHDLTDVIDAADPNTIQAEVVALETAVGTNPATGATQAAGSYLASNRTFASLSARVTNVEHGLVADTHTQYVHKSGGDTVAATSSGDTSLTVQANGGRGLEVKDTSGNTKVYTDTDGNLRINGSEIPVTQSQAGSTASTQAAGDASDGGVATDYSRADHKHAMPAGDGPAGTATFRTLGTGAQQAAAGNHNHTSLNLTTFTEAQSALAASATTTLNLNNGTVFKVSLGTNTTVAFSNVPGSGKTVSITVVFIQDATGGRTISWPASVKWSNGVQPTQNTTASSVNIYTLFTFDGGATWYAFLSGKGMA